MDTHTRIDQSRTGHYAADRLDRGAWKRRPAWRRRVARWPAAVARDWLDALLSSRFWRQAVVSLAIFGAVVVVQRIPFQPARTAENFLRSIVTTGYGVQDLREAVPVSKWLGGVRLPEAFRWPWNEKTGTPAPPSESGGVMEQPVLVRPVEGQVIAEFGWRTKPDGGSELHEGLDFASAEGTEVAAAAPGRVVAVTETESGLKAIELDHGGGLTTYYDRCAEVVVRTGDEVQAGATIGVLGPGDAGVARLHFEVRMNGAPVDPAPWLQE